MYKIQSELGVNGEDIDREILSAADDKLIMIRGYTEGDTVQELEKFKIYCKQAYSEYEKQVRSYSDWDKSKITTIPPILLDLRKVDLD